MTSTQQNNLLTRHQRVVLCEVCELSPAVVTCKADAASLCGTCDLDIHSANPLASRHVRVPIVHSYDSEEEAEAATWLLPDPNTNNNNNNEDHLDDDESELAVYKSAEYLFSDVDPYLDLGLVSGQGKMNRVVRDEEEEKRYCCDRAVPVQNVHEYGSGQGLDPVVDGYPTYNEVDYSGSKPLIMYNFTSQSNSRTVSCSSLDVGVVPDHNAMADVSNGYIKPEALPTPLSGIDREARVLRYKEKRKNRKFIKTIRYASRKAYAEIRPRIKGRFAKRNEHDVDSLVAADGSYGVVPTF